MSKSSTEVRVDPRHRPELCVGGKSSFDHPFVVGGRLVGVLSLDGASAHVIVSVPCDAPPSLEGKYIRAYGRAEKGATPPNPKVVLDDATLADDADAVTMTVDVQLLLTALAALGEPAAETAAKVLGRPTAVTLTFSSEQQGQTVLTPVTVTVGTVAATAGNRDKIGIGVLMPIMR